MTVYAIDQRTTNAELMVDCRTLGYLSDDMSILDPTYGEAGAFWNLWRPKHLVTSDLHTDADHDWDFTDLSDEWRWEAIVFDPPYKLNGTSSGKGPAASDERYGVHREYKSWQAKHQLIRDGITSCVNVLVPRGWLLVKCQDQVCSGRKRWQTHEFTQHAESLGCRLVDMMHVYGTREQPPGRTQRHAQQDYSTLLVLQRGK